ncbi:CbtA family protein [Actinokineospora fastidiosa]|uniref:Membrane protein n=1 Tax=Actinokineospora fastidiosa TaxID=1816 RepID=A0A918GM98_9PSEU|nr:CbtA family protein [Actinokineospora fastidiosa]GGS47736.1 membrane protein [Actinokineospora fastidiosa]
MPLTETPTLTVRSLLVWGLLAGLVGGLLAFGFASVFGEPAVERAIALEESAGGHSHGGDGHSHAEEPTEEPADEPVSRAFQATGGLGIGAVAYGLGLGGLFGIAFAFAYGRVGRLTPRATALALAGFGYVAVVLVPFLTYPANPPAVGQAGTIEERTALYFAMIAVSVVAAVLAGAATTRLTPRLGGWPAGVLAAVGYVVVVTAVAKLLPSYREVPDGFPGDLLWEFRIASLGTSAVLWAGIGVVFAVLLHRGTARR